MAKSLQISGNIKMLDDSTEICSEALSISENYTEITVQDISLAASASDQAISFGGVTNAQLAIIVPTYASSGSPANYLTVKVNGGTESINIGKMLVLGGESSNAITSLSISNPDASNAVSIKIYLCE